MTDDICPGSLTLEIDYVAQLLQREMLERIDPLKHDTTLRPYLFIDTYHHN